MTHSGEESEFLTEEQTNVLIPLLLDDPLWDKNQVMNNQNFVVLIPLLLDDPLWDHLRNTLKLVLRNVLIPLLLDDPLWV